MATLTKESSVSIRQSEQESSARPAAPRVEKSSGSDEGQRRRSGLLGRIQDSLEEVRSEINKVTWPSRTETKNLTIVVIGISVLVGGILGIVDLILVALVQFITGASGF